MKRTIGTVAAEVMSAALWFATAAIAGFIVLIALFKLGVAAHIDILFYRGVLLCAVAFVLTTALAYFAGRAIQCASLRDALAAGFLSLGLNLSILVIGPVTFDRSNSVFILGYMATAPERPLTAAQIDAAFREVYLGRMQQIERRMDEQLRSGNVVRAGAGYVISPQGLSFLAWARRIGWLFDVDARLLDQRPSSARP